MAIDNKEKEVLNVPHLRFPEFTEEWKETKLGKIAEITKGSGISKDRLSEYGSPCILYGELYTKYKSEIINEVYSRTELDSSLLVKSKANDVIIPCSGETAIDISTARCVPFNNILLGGDLNIIRLKNNDGGFFAYQLNGTRKKDIARVAQGVSVVHLYGENLKHIRVYHPAIEEQKKITRLLSLIDKRIATQNKIIEKLQSLIKGLSQQLLSSENDWILYRLDDLAQIKSGYSGTQVSYQTPYKVSRIETISKHCIDIQRIGYVECIPESYRLNVGNILFSNINSIQYIGNTAYLDKDYGLYHGMNLLRIIPNTTIVRPRFLHLLLCTDWAINHFQTICNKAVSQASINQTALGKSRFPIPPMSVQQQICSMFELTERKLDNEQEYISCLQQQKRYLLQKMFI
ncbi:restriction endonuclease subunit S [Bacteroides uniformis]|uniref:Restriction endonuclease subunit S n=1 Tax=Bacteroides uniformis TaxID=820 RepID=A0A412BEU8_BACUN|nr:restriction endonuclease subunit S [Bacteroides uniformis]RGQ52432.1 restriction endonuclease subunit S [Bacteroides uniformis]